MHHFFLKHPRSVNESYIQHACFALHFSGVMFCAAGAALIHAFFPALFEKTASRMTHDLCARMRDRTH